ncbi:hypothetical protein J2Q01_10290 [Tenacibaculum finnmarkense genomovar finnmarkense]|nr:hypothetical protein [Tenacibaculum finnmarkense genomovar finnmarkense]MCG8723918.1 hypothetical protein [Tenacibaculum finnmarkense]MCG8765633.1 hypothetical protein [Tenacibaculum finnmarkense]MCG8778551.1 hypothetical protein [Tenacibaculum finnmarkense]MCM8907042.1 hypothetical protein [Tenacibaculum finnmarkense genomovar finnmarkense]
MAYFDIEKILCPILVQNTLFGEKITRYKDIYSSFDSSTKIKNQLPEDGMKIESKKEVEHVSSLFMRFYEEDALPYFEKWHSLTVLYEFIQYKDDEDLWDILGQFAPMKKAVIYRLCNDDSALQLINDYYQDQKKYYEEDSKDIDNIRYYNASKELKEILEKTLPIYNVEV